MKKTAYVYDKWLSSLGGGEVVACNFARILADIGYDVTFICGKLIDPKTIKDKLNIELFDIKFIEIWNDEETLSKTIYNSDLFINCGFMDYSYASAKLNLIYIYFPTEADDNIKGKLITKYILPVSSYFLKPLEKVDDTQYVFYYLQQNKKYSVNIEAKYKKFSKSNIKSFNPKITNAKVISQKIQVNHFSNTLNCEIELIPTQDTIHYSLKNSNPSEIIYSAPEIISILSKIPQIKQIQTRLNVKLRSGLYTNTIARLNSYSQILATSNYANKWINKYWNKESTTFYAPVPLIKPNDKIIKKNYICSVGRFFTTGHGKKQDIMINAFIKLYNQGLTNWELHLAGGLGDEESSVVYVSKLKEISQGYPIYFHFNQSRNYIEKLYLESKIYWHAAGFGIDKNKYPIKFEHFGITPIEAMSAGCIPVLFNGGGLTEVIDTLNLNPNIHLFNTVDELVSNTKQIIENKVNLPTNYHTVLANLFGFDRFKKQLLDLINSNNQNTRNK